MNSPVQPPQCPIQGLDFFSPETVNSPWALYKRMRDEAPVCYVPEMGVYMVTSYRHIKEVIPNIETFSNESEEFIAAARTQWLRQMPPAVQEEYARITADTVRLKPVMVSNDPPAHTRYRRFAVELFNPGRIRKGEAHIRSIIQEMAAQMIGGRSGNVRVDFMKAFARPVPLRVLADRIGIPPADFEFFSAAAIARGAEFLSLDMSPETVLKHARLTRDFFNYILEQVRARRARGPEGRSDDFFGILSHGTLKLEDGSERPLDEDEIISMLDQFIVAGHETTTGSLAIGLKTMIENPGLEERLRGSEALIKKFVEEILRLETPIQGMPRIVKKAAVLGGVPLKPGDLLVLRYGSANRDEAVFECPNQLDLERKNINQHVGFGMGVHSCVGAPLARQELNIAFATLLDRIENIRRAPGSAEPSVVPSFMLRTFLDLEISFDVRRG